MELVSKGVSRPADALAQGVAALDHEVFDHAVEHAAVVVRFLDLLARPRIGPLFRTFREADEVLNRSRSLLIVEADGEVPLARHELRVNSRQRWLLVCNWQVKG